MPLSQPERIARDHTLDGVSGSLSRRPVVMRQNGCIFLPAMPCVAPDLKHNSKCHGCQFDLSKPLANFLENVVRLALRDMKPFLQNALSGILARVHELMQRDPEIRQTILEKDQKTASPRLQGIRKIILEEARRYGPSPAPEPPPPASLFPGPPVPPRDTTRSETSSASPTPQNPFGTPAD